MNRITLLAALAALAVSPAFADGRTQLLSSVGPELPRYVADVDPNTLSTAQLSRLHMTIYGDGSESFKQRRVRSILGGRFSLFGSLKLGVSN